jgi:hypothetical protein
MNPDTGFRINSLPFAHQTIDGEVVIVDVENGTYYSLRDTGAEVWSLLESGAGLQEIVRELGRRYQTGPGEIEAGVARLLTELQQEGILTPDPAAGAMSGRGADDLAGTPKPTFARPVLERFTDMKDLLLLDPIHEGGDVGWPIIKYPDP